MSCFFSKSRSRYVRSFFCSMLARPFLVALTDAIAPPLLPQGLAADPQDRGGAGLAPGHLIEHVPDVGLFDVLQGRLPVAPCPEGGGLLQEGARQGRRRHFAARG